MSLKDTMSVNNREKLADFMAKWAYILSEKHTKEELESPRLRNLMGLLPMPTEIKARCTEVQRGWSDQTRQNRMDRFTDDAWLPLILNEKLAVRRN